MKNRTKKKSQNLRKQTKKIRQRGGNNKTNKNKNATPAPEPTPEPEPAEEQSTETVEESEPSTNALIRSTINDDSNSFLFALPCKNRSIG